MRPIAVRLFVLVSALAIGCGSSAAPHPDGAVGTGGAGGSASGSGGSRGDGGAGVDAAAGSSVAGSGGTDGGDSTQPPPDAGAAGCFGPCLEPLLEQCPRVGQSCTKAMSGTDTVTCYANGVKELADASGTMATRNKANGELCLTVHVVPGQYQDFADGQGNPVAHLEFTGSTTQYLVTCVDTGIAMMVDLTSQQCLAYANQSAQQCATGSCIW